MTSSLAYEAVRLRAQTQIGRSPFFYQLLHRARSVPRSQNLVDATSDVCIEAPSGSGNSFFVNGFRMINPGVRVAHHHHVAAQVKRSVALHIPTLVILRNPIDCVASRSQRAPWMTGPVFAQWICFFRAVEALRDSVLTLSFECITRDPGGAVEKMNARFGSDFESTFPEPEAVFAHMDAAYSQTSPEDSQNPNRPDPDRAAARTRSRRIAEAHRLAARAAALYERLQSSVE